MKTYYIPEGTWPLRSQPYHDLMARAGFKRSGPNAEILVLPGGSDLGIRQERDAVEIHQWHKWRADGKPVLGICRGLQLALHLEGAALLEHVPDWKDEMIHTTITGDWRGQSSWHLTNEGLYTNSRHHQGFAEVPSGWEILDQTADGIIEAAATANVFLVQWHPEHEEMNGTPAQDWWIEKAQDYVNR